MNEQDTKDTRELEDFKSTLAYHNLNEAFNQFIDFIRSNEAPDPIRIIHAATRLYRAVDASLVVTKLSAFPIQAAFEEFSQGKIITLPEDKILKYHRIFFAMSSTLVQEITGAGMYAYSAFAQAIRIKEKEHLSLKAQLKAHDEFSKKIPREDVEMNNCILHYLQDEANHESTTIDYLLKEYIKEIIEGKAQVAEKFSKLFEFSALTERRRRMFARKLSKINIKNKKNKEVSSVLYDIENNGNLKLREGIEALKISFPYVSPVSKIEKVEEARVDFIIKEKKPNFLSIKIASLVKRFFPGTVTKRDEINEIRHSFQYWFNSVRFMKNIYLLSEKFPLKQKNLSNGITFEDKVKDILSLSQKELVRIHRVVSSAQFQNLIYQTENHDPKVNHVKKCMIKFEEMLEKKLNANKKNTSIVDAQSNSQLSSNGFSVVSLEIPVIKILPKNKEAIDEFLREVSQAPAEVQSLKVYSA